MTVTILRSSNGVLDQIEQGSLKDFASRIASGKPKILLHLHGGLVDQDAAEKMAERLSGSGENAYNAPADWEQIYIVWRTGAIETLKTNWRDLAKNDRLYNALLRRLLEFVSSKVSVAELAGRSVGAERVLTQAEISKRLDSEQEFPFEDIDNLTIDSATGRSIGLIDVDAEAELQLELEADTVLYQIAADIEASVAESQSVTARAGLDGDATSGRSALSRLDSEIVAELETSAEISISSRGIIAGSLIKAIIKHGVKIGTRVIKRYRAGRDHGLHATIAEEIARELYGDLIGSIIWGMMKGDATDHFKPAALGEQLIKAIAANPDAKLVIVAHSAGSIFASELLLWSAKNDVSFKTDLIFLAPAVRASKFAAALEKAHDRIGRFRMFAMSDALERKDSVLGNNLSFIYPSSLLYLVSGLFEEHADEGLWDAPLVGMQRFLVGDSSWLTDVNEGPSLAAVRKFLATNGHMSVFSPSGAGDGLNCNAISHGGFDDEASTLKSVATFLA